MRGWLMRSVHILAILLVGSLCIVGTAQAQSVPPDVNNPSAVQFTASADHGSIDSYEMDILRPDGSVCKRSTLGNRSPIARIAVPPRSTSSRLRLRRATRCACGLRPVPRSRRMR